MLLEHLLQNHTLRPSVLEIPSLVIPLWSYESPLRKDSVGSRVHALPFYRSWPGHPDPGISCPNGPKARHKSVLQGRLYSTQWGGQGVTVCRSRECEWLRNSVSIHVLANLREWVVAKRKGVDQSLGASSFWTTTFWCKTFLRCFAHIVLFDPTEHFRERFIITLWESGWRELSN